MQSDEAYASPLKLHESTHLFAPFEVEYEGRGGALWSKVGAEIRVFPTLDLGEGLGDYWVVGGEGGAGMGVGGGEGIGGRGCGEEGRAAGEEGIEEGGEGGAEGRGRAKGEGGRREKGGGEDRGEGRWERWEIPLRV